jgi:hypothetical protein
MHEITQQYPYYICRREGVFSSLDIAVFWNVTPCNLVRVTDFSEQNLLPPSSRQYRNVYIKALIISVVSSILFCVLKCVSELS